MFYKCPCKLCPSIFHLGQVVASLIAEDVLALFTEVVLLTWGKSNQSEPVQFCWILLSCESHPVLGQEI